MKLFLFFIFSLLAMFAQVKSADKYKNLLAYYSLIDEFDTKAKAIDSSINWNDRLHEVLSIPTDEIMNTLKRTNAQWIDQLIAGFIKNADQLKNSFPAGESSKSTKQLDKQIKSINDAHKKMLSTMHLVILDVMEPSFELITGFDDAYTKLTKKTLNQTFLDSVKQTLPKLKRKHDELLTKITSNLNGVFIGSRDDYINKVSSLNSPSVEHTGSISNALNEIKRAQDNFLVAIQKLSKDLKAFAAEAVKCAGVLLESKKLKLKSYKQPKEGELKKLEEKFEELFEEMRLR